MKFFLIGGIIFFVGASLQSMAQSTKLESTTELLLVPKKKVASTQAEPQKSERYVQKKLPAKKVPTKVVPTPESSSEMNVYLVPDNKKSQLSPAEREDISKSLFGASLGKVPKTVVAPLSSASAPPAKVTAGYRAESRPAAETKKTSTSDSISSTQIKNLPEPKNNLSEGLPMGPPKPELAIEPPSSPQVVPQGSEILFPGADQDRITEYVEQIHPEDPRLNVAELSVGSGLITNDSRSNYSYRGYSISSPYLNFMGRFWLSPFMGIYGSFLNSVGGDMTANPGDRSKISAQHEMTEFGVDLRKYYGLSRRASSLTYGLYFNEYRLIVPGDTQYRMKLRSSGFGFQVQARIPTSPIYSWTLGGKIIPRVQANEIATGADMSSGSLGESSRFSLVFGGELKLTRQNQIIWSLEGMVEKNQFNGQATRADPETGVAPSGVGVENRFLIFNFAYRWGQ